MGEWHIPIYYSQVWEYYALTPMEEEKLCLLEPRVGTSLRRGQSSLLEVRA